MKTDTYDLIILGAGPAGLSAAIYAGRFKMKTLVIGQDFGGEVSRIGKIWNYPGIKGVDGYDLMKTMKEQASENGVMFSDEEIIRIERDGDILKIFTEKEEIHSSSIILATGLERRKLGLLKEKELTGKGVHYCVTCDGPVYVGKTIAMVGGGDAAAKGAILASEYAKKVYLIVRGKELKSEPISLENIKKLGDKVETLYETEIKEIVGKEKLEKVILDRAGKKEELSVDGLFVEIGSTPNNLFTKSLGISLDEKGYVVSDSLMATNVPGIFVAGDLAGLFGHFKQIITSAATGAIAANSVYQYLKKRG